MDDVAAGPLVLYKRWRLRPHATVGDVAALVEARIRPAYARLSAEVTLGLEVALDGETVVAIQRWASRAAHEAATQSAEYGAWWADYEPALAEWDHLAELVSEWSTVAIA